MPSAHPDTEQLQRLLHGELSEPRLSAVRDHLAGCEPCRRRVEEAKAEEAEVHALLRHLDHAPPRVDARTIAAQERRRRVGWIRWAAGIVLGLGAVGGAYAVPGSPLRDLVDAMRDGAGRGRPSATAETPAQRLGPDVSGIAVLPGERLVIAFTSPRVEGRATVSLTDATDVVIRVLSGDARFTSGVDRLVIDTDGSAAILEIEIPRAAPWVEIVVGSRRVFLKEGARITSETSTDSLSPYELLLTGPGPVP